MRAHHPLRLAAAAALAALPATAPAQTDGLAGAAQEAGRLLQQALVQYSLVAARSAVELTYDGVSVDPRGGGLAIDGLVIRPRLDWDPDRACTIRAERIALPGAGLPALDRLVLTAEIDGLTVEPECLEPGPALALQSFGYERFVLDAAALRLDYHLPSSAATLAIDADLAEAARLALSAEFGYLWLAGMDGDGGDPRPVAELSHAELVVENAGAWERVSPMIEGQVGNLDALPQMVRALLGPALAGANGQPGPEARAFIDNAAEEVARFVRTGDRIVLTLAPEGGVMLGEDLFQSPATALATLAPRVSATPATLEDMIAPDRLAAALADGADPSAEDRLAVGRALLTGRGAPLAPEAGRALLRPLAEAWDAGAAMLIAEHMAGAGEPARAYAMALRARAGAASGAAALLSRLEARLAAGGMIEAEEAALTAWPGRPGWTATRDTAIEDGDVSALARLAAAAEAGRGMPPSHMQAYYLAGLAAAAGDRSAAALRDRIDARFARPAGGVAPGWAEARAAALAATLETWTEGGLAARIAARYAQGE